MHDIAASLNSNWGTRKSVHHDSIVWTSLYKGDGGCFPKIIKEDNLWQCETDLVLFKVFNFNFIPVNLKDSHILTLLWNKPSMKYTWIYLTILPVPELNHKFRKILNRNTLKVSYSCLPNIASIISAHNKKILHKQPNPVANNNLCNCRNRNDCPLDGSCLTESVIYKCHVTQSENDEGKHYIGLTGGKFKDRWASHIIHSDVGNRM